MRIASLVPSATEALFMLGLGDSVVAVTHECDWPVAARQRPRLTTSIVPEGLGQAQIDAAVRELTGSGEAIYRLDDDALRRLKPDLIVTQAVCPVCAVSYEEVCAIAAGLTGRPAVLSLDPMTLPDVLDDLVRIAAAAGVPERGKRLRADLAARIEAVRGAVAGAPRPRVLPLEWLDPPYVAGHWVPEMITAAGGADVAAAPGQRSRTASWDELRALQAEIVAVMPCGLYAAAAAAAARAVEAEIGALGAARVFAVDAASSFSRPGPRLVDGVELLGHLFHPGAFPPPAGLAWEHLPELAPLGPA